MSSSHPYLTVVLSALLAAALLVMAGCSGSPKTASAKPPARAQAPAITASKPVAPTPQNSAPSSAAGPTQNSQAVSGPAPAASSQPAPAAQPKADPVTDLIAAAEKEREQGEENYRAGNLEGAKQNFDAAFNKLMQSGLDIHADDRLQKELDRVLEGANGVKLATLPQGDGTEAEQKSEPAPIDEANELNPTADANVKAKAEAELKVTHSDLPLVMTDQVAGFINHFSGRGRGTLQQGLARSGRYEDMIRRVLHEEGVPEELIYLAQAESGFHPLAVSRVGARGMWQFMASRAKGYGLERNWWVDDRQDPEKATRAAAHHLKDLYNQFGDWYLAMAAYNSGPGTVQSAVKRTGYADFWELYNRNVLPKETRNYVPIIVAVTIMAKNPAQYGLDSVVKEKPMVYDTVTINYPIDLRLAAECVDVPASDLLDLNPSLLRLTTPKNRPFDLHLPVGTAEKFESAVAAIPADKRVWWRYHRVQGTETLASIARTYHTTSKAIAEANDLGEQSSSGFLSPDTRLVIPVAASKQADTSTYAHATTRYKIRHGDTVESVAENFGVSVKMLRVWNRLKGDNIAGRRVLYLHLPVTATKIDTQIASDHSSSSPRKTRNTKSTHSASAKQTSIPVATTDAPLHHKVKAGETLYSIASSYNTSVSALKRYNRDVAVLRPGMILVVREAR